MLVLKLVPVPTTPTPAHNPSGRGLPQLQRAPLPRERRLMALGLRLPELPPGELVESDPFPILF